MNFDSSLSLIHELVFDCNNDFYAYRDTGEFTDSGGSTFQRYLVDDLCEVLHDVV